MGEATKRRQPRRRAPRQSASSGRTSSARAQKISITVDEAILREARRVAHSTGRTLSAHITEALARDLRRRRLQQLVDEYEREHGTISGEELAEIRSAWQA